MRDAYEKITGAGAELIAIGTGNVKYARRFVEEEDIPFPVLVDDDAAAAHLVSVQRAGVWNLLGPSTYGESLKTWRRGHKIHMSGKRVFQLGATFVIGPGDAIGYEHIDETTVDHAPLDEIFAALDI